MSTQSFKDFIISLLRRGDLNEKICEKFFNKYEKEFQIAFTHRTFDPINNYEYYEFLGDAILGACVGKYVLEWDKKIVSVKYLTRLKHNITSKDQLSHIAYKCNFFDHIRLGNGSITTKKDRGMLYYKTEILPKMVKTPLEDEDFRSWLEDSFEAFLGLTSIIIDSNSKTNSLGFVICFKIVKSFLDEIEFSLKYEDIFDAKTRYKELCDKRWGFNGCLKYFETKDDNGKTWHKTQVYGYPFGDRTAKSENKKLLAEVTDLSKQISQHTACEKALSVLKEKYKIFDYPPDPYKKEN